MFNEEEQTIRYRNASLSLGNKQQQLAGLIQSNQQIVQEQLKVINSLETQNNVLIEKNNKIKNQIQQILRKKEKLPNKLMQNERLKLRAMDIEQLLAVQKVQNAIRQSELLVHVHQTQDKQLVVHKMQTKARTLQQKFNKQKDIQKQLDKQEQLIRKRIYSITKTSIRYSDILQIKENYSDNDRKQWINYLKLKQSTRQQTISLIKSKCKSLVKGFIPIDLRRLGWSVLIQNKLCLTQSLYCYYFENKKVPEKVLLQIQKDIDRTFPIISSIQKNFAIQLKQIIEIFHCYRPDVSYVQGMTYPAGILLLILDKYKAWECFCNLVFTNEIIYKMYIFDLQKMALYCRAFDLLIDDYFPKLSEVMKQHDIHSQIYLIQWFYTMFSRSFSISTVFKIWDIFLFFGQAVLYQVGLAIFDQLKELLILLDYEQSIELIKNFSNKISQDKILSQLSSNKPPTDKVRDIYKKVLEMNNVATNIQL